MSDKKIFISGIAGFLGSHLALFFTQKKYNVAGCDNMVGGYIDNVPEKIEFYQADCNDFNKMKEITQGVDTVFHCAATAYEGLSVFSPNLVSKNVFQATVSLLTAAIQNKVRRFIFFSSMARYGKNKSPFKEEYKPAPLDPYGIAKVAAEEMIKNLSDIHGIERVIVVPHDIYGPRQKYDDPYRNVVSIMINRMLQGRQPVIYGDGRQLRCFSYIDDCISSLGKMVDAENIAGEVINIGPDEEFVTINELAGIIAGELEFKLEPIYVPDRPQEVKEATCSSEKVRNLLGYKTKFSLKTGVRKTVEYIRKKGALPFKYHLELEIINSKTPLTWKDRIF